MLLRYSLAMDDVAQEIERAIVRVLGNGLRTADIMATGAARVGTGRDGRGSAEGTGQGARIARQQPLLGPARGVAEDRGLR